MESTGEHGEVGGRSRVKLGMVRPLRDEGHDSRQREQYGGRTSGPPPHTYRDGAENP